MSEGLLSQYSLAKEQIDRVEGRGNSDAGGDDEDEVSDEGSDEAPEQG